MAWDFRSWTRTIQLVSCGCRPTPVNADQPRSRPVTLDMDLRFQISDFGGGCLSHREKTFRKDLPGNRLSSPNVFSRLKNGETSVGQLFIDREPKVSRG